MFMKTPKNLSIQRWRGGSTIPRMFYRNINISKMVCAHFETGLTSCFFVFSSLCCKTHAVDIMHLSDSLTAYPPFDHRESWSLSQLSHPGQVTSPSHNHTHTHGLETFTLARMSPDWGRKSGGNPRRDRQKMQTMQKGPGSPGCSKEKPPRCEWTVLTSARLHPVQWYNAPDLMHCQWLLFLYAIRNVHLLKCKK